MYINIYLISLDISQRDVTFEIKMYEVKFEKFSSIKRNKFLQSFIFHFKFVARFSQRSHFCVN